jgi:hypothetical protein
VDAAVAALAGGGVADAAGYDVELSPDPAFVHDVMRLTPGAATELTLAGALPAVGARLYWRARAVLPEGPSRWSPPARFYAGRPRDVDAHLAREAARLDAARREAARRRAEDAARLDLVPPYLREYATTPPAVAAGLGVMLLGTMVTVVLLVLGGALIP